MIDLSGSKHGCVLVKYLGVPLIPWMLSDKHCKPINGWATKKRSYAAHLQSRKGKDCKATGPRWIATLVHLSKQGGWNQTCYMRLHGYSIVGLSPHGLHWLRTTIFKAETFSPLFPPSSAHMLGENCSSKGTESIYGRASDWKWGWHLVLVQQLALPQSSHFP